MAQRSNNAISTFVGFHAHCVCICAQSVHMSKCAHISVLKCTNRTCVKMRNIQVFGLYKPYPLCYIYQTFIVDPLANMFSTYCSSPAITYIFIFQDTTTPTTVLACLKILTVLLMS